MNYSEELQKLEEKRAKLVKAHSDLLCSFIGDYDVPTDKLMELNKMFFDYGTICSDRTDAFNKDLQERVSKTLFTTKTIV
jgi:hypothetical protein